MKSALVGVHRSFIGLRRRTSALHARCGAVRGHVPAGRRHGRVRLCPAPSLPTAPTGAPFLRGGASHEAEGRGGGTGRVRAPAGRLRLLRQIRNELVPGVEQFLLVDDVVAVEDGAALVPGQERGDPLGDAGADQVAGGGAAAIVEEAGRHAGRLTGGAPRRAPAPDGDAVAVEDEWVVGVAARPSARQGLGNRVRNGENPPHQGLRARPRWTWPTRWKWRHCSVGSITTAASRWSSPRTI